MPRRELHTISLEPTMGARFQPTGFPNLGAAEFDRPTDDGGWQRCLLVESEQSMANRLEATLWDAPAQQPIDLIADLPSMVVRRDDGSFVTSSRLEAHRIATPYIREAVTADGQSGTELIIESLGLTDTRQRSPFEVAEGIYRLDPMCLIHGVFLSDKSFTGNPRVQRALTANIEAYDVKEAYSGGVKKDSVSQSSTGGGSSEGYGMVPFDRTEWVARDVVARAALDLDQIRDYRLTDVQTSLLTAIARLQIATLFSGPLRLRTNCDLTVTEHTVMLDGESVDRPDPAELRAEIEDLVGRLGDGASGEVALAEK